MGTREQLMPDGSITVTTDGGGFFIDSGMAMQRYQVVSAISGLEWNLKTGGHIRRGYTQDCLAFITWMMESIPEEDLIACGKGKFVPYPRSRKGKERAVEDGKWLLACFNASAVSIELDS